MAAGRQRRKVLRPDHDASHCIGVPAHPAGAFPAPAASRGFFLRNQPGAGRVSDYGSGQGTGSPAHPGRRSRVGRTTGDIRTVRPVRPGQDHRRAGAFPEHRHRRPDRPRVHRAERFREADRRQDRHELHDRLARRPGQPVRHDLAEDPGELHPDRFRLRPGKQYPGQRNEHGGLRPAHLRRRTAVQAAAARHFRHRQPELELLCRAVLVHRRGTGPEPPPRRDRHED